MIPSPNRVRRVAAGFGMLSAVAAASHFVLFPNLARAQASSKASFKASTETRPWKHPARKQSSQLGVAWLSAPASTMIRIPASTFIMGSTRDEIVEAAARCALSSGAATCKPEQFSDELPAHRVSLSSYWIDRTEVTVREYQRCVALKRCEPVPYWRGAERFEKPEYPVTLVRWKDAQDYCRFRGARLPTEAEYERAARGLSRRWFPWGNLFNRRAANHGRSGLASADGQDGFLELAPVGSFAAGQTPNKIMDLAGNVAEWVYDRYGAYTADAVRDPKGPKSNPSSSRVFRGGHFASPPVRLRAASRGHAPPNTRQPQLGFRCARSDKPPLALKPATSEKG